jgi:hypothetical protein
VPLQVKLPDPQLQQTSGAIRVMSQQIQLVHLVLATAERRRAQQVQQQQQQQQVQQQQVTP